MRLTASGGLVFQRSAGLPDEIHCPVRTGDGDNIEAIALEVVIGLEEAVEVLGEALPELLERLHVGECAALGEPSDEPVVADRVGLAVLLFRLFGLDDSEQARSDQAADGKGRFGQDQDVQRIAVFGQCRRDEAEVEREGDAGGKNAAELVDSMLRVEIELGPAAGGGFDDRPSDQRLRIELMVELMGKDVHPRPINKQPPGCVNRAAAWGSSKAQAPIRTGVPTCVMV